MCVCLYVCVCVLNIGKYQNIYIEMFQSRQTGK